MIGLVSELGSDHTESLTKRQTSMDHVTLDNTVTAALQCLHWVSTHWNSTYKLILWFDEIKIYFKTVADIFIHSNLTLLYFTMLRIYLFYNNNTRLQISHRVILLGGE